VRWLAAVASGCWLLAASAHDLITADSAQGWLKALGEHQSVLESGAAAARKAEAAYQAGLVLDRIRELLNLDLQAHGEVSGLASKYLLAELTARKHAPDFSQPRRRYLSNARYFRQALRLAPAAPFAADAGFRLLDGLYDDHFADDPLGAADAAGITGELIRLAEDLDARYPLHPRREEIAFISAILYTRSARDCAADGGGLLRKARAAIAEFEQRYAGSLRAAAMPVLREALANC
jgi:hypothetical protein